MPTEKCKHSNNNPRTHIDSFHRFQPAYTQPEHKAQRLLSLEPYHEDVQRLEAIIAPSIWWFSSSCGYFWRLGILVLSAPRPSLPTQPTITTRNYFLHRQLSHVFLCVCIRLYTPFSRLVILAFSWWPVLCSILSNQCHHPHSLPAPCWVTDLLPCDCDCFFIPFLVRLFSFVITIV